MVAVAELGAAVTVKSRYGVLSDNVQARQFYEWGEGEVVGTREEILGDDVLVEVAYGSSRTPLAAVRAVWR